MPNRDGSSRVALVPQPRSPGRMMAGTSGIGEFSTILAEPNSSRMMSPAKMSQALLEHKSNESAVLGLRSAVHTSVSRVDDEDRQKTYIVATYTDVLEPDDEHQR